MQLVAFFGQFGTGKDIASDCLFEKLNKNNFIWKRAAFASAVKSVFETSFDVDRNFIEKWKRIPEPPPGMLMPVRQALQFIGDGFRQIKQDIWIDIALRDESKNLIISDGRYFSEARNVKKKGGISVVLYRPGYINNDPNPSESQIKPIVEYCAKYLKEGPIDFDLIQELPIAYPPELPYYDYFIVNDGSLEDLYAKIDKLVPYVNKKYGLDNQR